MGMPLVPVCSEAPCANTLEGKPAGTKTCSKVCRQKRARRLKREKHERAVANATLPPHLAAVSQVVTDGALDAAHTALVEEMRPHVREAMTANVLASINTLVGLTPDAIAKLQEHMASDDEVISQRAVMMLLKYTMGNPSVAPPPTEQAPAPMSVTFNIPRPGDAIGPEVPVAATLPPEAVEEQRQCSDCSQHKGDSEFVGASPRCQTCFDALHATLKKRFAVEDETAPE